MKKTLTENISRYDEKMRFRMDGKTVRALLISAVPALVVGFLLSKFSIMLGIPATICLFLILF